METFFPNDLGNSQNGNRYVFLECFLFACLFFPGAGKGRERSYGYMNIWIFIWVTEFNKLLTNFR